jgi:hypothetical protein
VVPGNSSASELVRRLVASLAQACRALEEAQKTVEALCARWQEMESRT